jgi:hypothetical protein
VKTSNSAQRKTAHESWIRKFDNQMLNSIPIQGTIHNELARIQRHTRKLLPANEIQIAPLVSSVLTWVLVCK